MLFLVDIMHKTLRGEGNGTKILLVEICRVVFLKDLGVGEDLEAQMDDNFKDNDQLVENEVSRVEGVGER